MSAPRILLIKQTSLGDVIHSTLALEAIAAQWPGATVDFMVDRSAALALEGNPHIGRRLITDRHGWGASLRRPWAWPRLAAALWRLIRELRSESYDIALDLQGIERSVLFLYLAKAKFKAHKGARYPFLPGFRNPQRDDHALAELRGTLALAGIQAQDACPRLYLDPQGLPALLPKLPAALAAALAAGTPVVTVSPFTSWATKDCPLAAWLEAARRIRSQRPDALFAFTATSEHRAAVQTAIAAAAAQDWAFNLAGATSIRELLQLIRASTVVMASEGATAHMASALQRPVAVVFGPTSPARVGPWGAHARVIRSTTAPCLGCYRRRCPAPAWICMNGLEAQIATAALELMSAQT